MSTPIPNTSLKLLVFIQFLTGGAMSLGLGMLGGFQLGASSAIGAALMLANSLLHGWTWHRILEKKSIAWTLLIIVIKYAVLLGSIFLALQTNWFKVLGAGLGIASFTLAALTFAVFERKKEKN